MDDVGITAEGDVVVHSDGLHQLITSGVPGVAHGVIHGLSFDADGATLRWEGRSSANIVNLYRGAIDALPSGAPAACPPRPTRPRPLPTRRLPPGGRGGTTSPRGRTEPEKEA